MIWQLDLLILTLIVLCAIATINVKDLLSAAIIFGAYSFLMCLLWTEMGSVDVGFTEATVGAGVGTVFFIAAIYRTTRKVKIDMDMNPSKFCALCAVSLVGIILLIAEGEFPKWADPGAPASMHVSPHFITQSIEETAVPNLVTSVLGDYRGFDTMFETAVIFAAGIAVFAILRRTRREDEVETVATAESVDVYQDTIIRWICRQMVPFMQLFALYVVAHGHHSPGGGFQGGVILGASFILLNMSYDMKTVLIRLNERWNILLGNIGVFIYAGIGLLCLVLGANFLDYSALSKILPATSSIMARSHGILGIEIGVAIAVMAIMISIYRNIASHGEFDEGL
ncbi:DUF4040 domain-containing protein [Thermodesulfobacteriota bacterium]